MNLYSSMAQSAPLSSKEAPELDPQRLPVHVAIIMDGNGRWARAQGKSRLYGHDQGYKTLKNIVYAARDLGIRYLTVYGFSSENWRRSEEEVGGLMDLMLRAIRNEMEELVQNRVRVRVSGRLHELPSELRAEFEKAMQRTAPFDGLIFNLAINYGGRAEVVDAVRRIAQRVQQRELTPESIDENTIAQHLYWPDIPDPDLLIRTAGELRLSNFLLWETAYSEIYVTPVCWPEFTREHLVEALREYQRRVRKFGAILE